MCGIIGIVDKNLKYSQDELGLIAGKMLDLISHRGGDSYGMSVFNNVVVGHTRLAINDISTKANQPTEDDCLIFSFNGEIYNHLELRDKFFKDLFFDSNSDTLTLMELLSRFSLSKTLEVVEGMFAISYIDKESKKIYLALDKFGIKPLYYINTKEFFAWASEIKSFSAIPGFNFELNEERLQEQLVFRYIYGEQTLFKNIYKLLAGEYCELDLDSKSMLKNKYYLPSAKESSQSLEDIIKDSILKHTMGDFPTSLQLSGGTDSSLLGHFLSGQIKDNLLTYSIGLRDDKWNEFRFSDYVVSKIHSKHKKIVFEPKDFKNLIGRVTFLLDEPIVHPNTIPIYLLSKKARIDTKIVLTGEGADEILLGYKRHRDLKKDTDIFINAFNHPDEVSSIFKKQSSDDFSSRRKLFKDLPADIEEKISLYEMHTYLPHVLMRQDRAGMGANIENRVPFLCSPVVEKCLALKNRVGDLGLKSPLKEIGLKYFPEEFVMREKCGFGLPIKDWLIDRNVLLPLLESLVSSEVVVKYFDQNKIQEIVSSHITNKRDNSGILFGLISLRVWYDIFILGKSVDLSI